MNMTSKTHRYTQMLIGLAWIYGLFWFVLVLHRRRHDVLHTGRMETSIWYYGLPGQPAPIALTLDHLNGFLFMLPPVMYTLTLWRVKTMVRGAHHWYYIIDSTAQDNSRIIVADGAKSRALAHRSECNDLFGVFILGHLVRVFNDAD